MEIEMQGRYKQAALFILILTVSAGLRLYHLGFESIWLDEGYTIRFASYDLKRIFFLQDTSPPLYYILMHYWIRLFGESEFSIRLPSLLFGILAIIMIYRLGSAIFDREAALIGSLLLGLSVFHLAHSQDARSYSLAVLMSLASMYYFLRVLVRQDLRTVASYLCCS